MNRHTLYYNVPPTKWEESMMIGCGRMGASIMAGVACETLYLNEESVWSEHKNNAPVPDMKERLDQIRALLSEGKPKAANDLAGRLLRGCYREIGSYEGAGKLNIELHEGESAANYGRWLDLKNGMASLSYTKMGTTYKREYFASFPDDVIVCRITSSGAPINACVSYERERMLSCISADGTLTATAKTVFGEHEFCVKAKAVTDGDVTSRDGQILISNAAEICIYVVIGTQFNLGDGYVDGTVFPTELDYEAIKARHIADFSALMSRSDLELPTMKETDEFPIQDHFLIRTIPGPKDESLFAFQWNFGKYLLISSSRKGTLPANLQGLWTKGDFNPWSGDYHTNINLQANYWAAETVGLSDCHTPLFDYMNGYLLESGKQTAKLCYGTRGCVVHHLSDIYGFTLPADGPWGLWPHGASWLSLHMWEHYLFTEDADFLRNTAYEFIRESALFFLDNLHRDAKGRLVYAPSTSPENKYYAEEDGKRAVCFLTASSTMDIQIISTVFDIYTKSSEILGIADADTAAVAVARLELPKMQVGKHGQLMEWLEDYDEVDVGHRHISHAFGLYPGSLITRETPELCRAIETSINRRIASADRTFGDIGWSLNWKGAMFARLRRGDRAYSMLNTFISKCVNNSLRDIIKLPALLGEVFQIDGPLSYVAAVCEMLIQSHEKVISLLPALPSRWDRGSFKGFRARGGYELDVSWSDHAVRSFTVRSSTPRTCYIELPPKQTEACFKDENGNVYYTHDGILNLPVSGETTLSLVMTKRQV